MISFVSFLILVWIKGTFAYIVSSTTSSSAVISSPTFLLSPITTKKNESETRVKYDLGLGKNLPVTKSQKSFQLHHDIHQAVEYWMVSDSARSFPQPDSQLEKNTPEIPISASTAKKLYPIIPNRFSDDVIYISDSEQEAQMQAVWTLHPNNVDMNTMWVEMLIHHERMNYAAV
jgi:hypothetical protein